MLISFSEDYCNAWSRALSKALNLPLYKQRYVTYPEVLRSNNVYAPWLPLCFSDSKTEIQEFCSSYAAPRRLFLSVVETLAPRHGKLPLKTYAKSGILFYCMQTDRVYENYFDGLSKRTRRYINQAQKNMKFCEYKTLNEAASHLPAFYSMLVKSHIEFLSPVPPLSLFIELMASKCLRLLIGFDNTTDEVAGYLFYCLDSKLVHFSWIATHRQSRNNYTSIGLYDHVIRKAFATDVKICSMGTTSNIGCASFKAKIGFRPALIHKASVSLDGKVRLIAAQRMLIFKRMLLRMMAGRLIYVLIRFKKHGLYLKVSDFIWRHSYGL